MDLKQRYGFERVKVVNPHNNSSRKYYQKKMIKHHSFALVTHLNDINLNDRNLNLHVR